jgi:POT family proton-dependent oligopeptide transporter
MAIPIIPAFYAGLTLIIIGTGLLKPNVSTMVGELYPEGGARRDAGFSIFYMGINLGAFLGPTLCGLMGESYSFHLGFSIAGIGMVVGLIQYRLGERHLGTVGSFKPDADIQVITQRSRTATKAFGGGFLAIALMSYLMWSGALPLTVLQLAQALGYGIFIMSGLFFLYLFVAGGLTSLEKKRLAVIVWLFLLVAIFWSGFEQAGSSMNIFARDLTNRTVMGWEMPASWLQDVNAFFIVVMAPVFGFIWTWLATRNANPSIPAKFALGLFGLAVGFAVLAWGSANASATNRVSMSWLIVTYFLHTVGELCISPVGLSSMTKLAPKGRVGQMMGVWFVGAAFGNLLAGLAAGLLDSLPASQLFWAVAALAGGTGLVALLASPFVKRWTGDVE